MRPGDIEAIERATVAAVAPPAVIEIDGWLVPLDGGTIGRAKSAVPLSHETGPETVAAIEAAFRAQGLAPAFRIADGPGLSAVRAELTHRGYAPTQPTAVEVGDVARLAGFAEPGEILGRPDEDWGGVFLGPGFDPVDGAHRVAALGRAAGSVFGRVRDGGRTVAVGVASFGQGWAGIHGMRTALYARGQGYAGRVLAALGGAAVTRGVASAFLQVEVANPARSLYRRAGFEPVWTYHYWR